MEYVVAGVASLVGLTLLGRGGSSKAGLVFSVLRVPLEAALIAFLKIGILDADEERRTKWMWDSAIVRLLPQPLFARY